MTDFAWLDSTPALVSATVLHSLGALGYLAGLAVYLHAKRNDRIPQRRSWVLWIGIVSIVANGIGGFMRTYLPGHPPLSAWAESPWVQVMVVKHVFTTIGAVGLVYLGVRGGRSDRDQAAVIGIVLSLVIPTLLGAQAQITSLGEGYDEDEPILDGIDYDDVTLQRAGTLNGNPVQPLLLEVPFDVSFGMAQLRYEVDLDPSIYDIAIALTDPFGAEREVRIGAPVEAIAIAGTWTLRFESTLVVDVPWTLDVEQFAVPADEALIVRSVTVPGDRFYEINTQLQQGESICWDWQSSRDVYFDVHTHFGGSYVPEEVVEGSASAGCYEAQRSGGHSLYWVPNGETQLQLRAWGPFELDSIVGDS